MIERYNAMKRRMDAGEDMADIANSYGVSKSWFYMYRRIIDKTYVPRAPRTGYAKLPKKAYRKRQTTQLQRIEVPVIENIPQSKSGKVAVVIGEASTIAGILKIQW